mmetsp:Transcript_61290/g.164909  ORF Transcript_61290/g.164909 Transcript_61290/m.164909 type:complete len:224 (+) Transcript_61290:42-713(+)
MRSGVCSGQRPGKRALRARESDQPIPALRANVREAGDTREFRDNVEDVVLGDHLVPMHDPRVERPVPLEEGLPGLGSARLVEVEASLLLRERMLQDSFPQLDSLGGGDIQRPGSPRPVQNCHGGLWEQHLQPGDEGGFPTLRPLHGVEQQQEVFASRLEDSQGHSLWGGPLGSLQHVDRVVDQGAHDEKDLVLPKLVLILEIPACPDKGEHTNCLYKHSRIIL